MRRVRKSHSATAMPVRNGLLPKIAASSRLPQGTHPRRGRARRAARLPHRRAPPARRRTPRREDAHPPAAAARHHLGRDAITASSHDPGEGGETRPDALPGQDLPKPAAVAEPQTPPHRRWSLHRSAARHVGRGAHHILRWSASLAAVLILFALFGIWRLMQGPIDWIGSRPLSKRRSSARGSGSRLPSRAFVSGSTAIRHQLDLRAVNVSVSLPDGEPLASFPEMATTSRSARCCAAGSRRRRWLSNARGCTWCAR